MKYFTKVDIKNPYGAINLKDNTEGTWWQKMNYIKNNSQFSGYDKWVDYTLFLNEEEWGKIRWVLIKSSVLDNLTFNFP